MPDTLVNLHRQDNLALVELDRPAALTSVDSVHGPLQGAVA